MKILKTILAELLFAFLIILNSCNSKENAPIDVDDARTSLTNQEIKELTSHFPMPVFLDSSMRQKFEKESFSILKKLNPKSKKSFYISKENYLKMINEIPENANRVSFSFIQFNKNKFPNKYSSLSKFDNVLYILYEYIDEDGNNIGNKFYAMHSLDKIVEISSNDALVMQKDYIKNIKNSLDGFVEGGQGNTLAVKMDKRELFAYKIKLVNDIKFDHIKVTLAQVSKKSAIFSKVNKSIQKKLAKISDDSEGQMTFITDALDVNGNVIEDLSGDDMNKLCPQDCP